MLTDPFPELDVKPHELRLQHRSILALTAAEPGVKLKTVAAEQRTGPLPYDALRQYVAKLRKWGYLYPSRPTWVLLTPAWRKAWEAKELDQHKRVATMRHILGVCERFGPVQQMQACAMLLQCSDTALRSAFVDLREAGVLHPWPGLVLTPQGEKACTEALNISVQPQTWLPAFPASYKA